MRLGRVFWSRPSARWPRPNLRAADTNAVLDAWFAAQANVHTLSADFVQTRTLKTLVQPLRGQRPLVVCAAQPISLGTGPAAANHRPAARGRNVRHLSAAQTRGALSPGRVRPARVARCHVACWMPVFRAPARNSMRNFKSNRSRKPTARGCWRCSRAAPPRARSCPNCA